MENTVSIEWAVIWQYQGKQIIASYEHPIRRAIILNDEAGVGIVESWAGREGENSIILNLDGTLRVRIYMPANIPRGYQFTDMYYIGDVLHVFAAGNGPDFRFSVNEFTGELGDPIVSR